ncbi:CDP-diacylglycerol--serine O-phosphatidyltransferase [Rickettsiales endosymbiont of Peranema trichophorum]|uniref:CDP-diacylglycerol--serine O-phosphatidyltransferase n=1 Tax=Rickettsiales endosymbiont of Peranema trichophorum TaxID=2486577 RepID=UPI001023E013|nr:CDP-diacylglycerol--serine O-phosphatidyltransferase [Rickettsiales endosymbiont of Peranema trichophorum]RZI46346.1 CDP-diacylglycerol--serine O-phosphatidyltransferase [Rickettsiales endosymbiont of Peranema trichophorum]
MIKKNKIRHKVTTSLPVPLYRLIPNMITILGLCLGISAIRYALDLKVQTAVGLIIIAAFMDGLDGRIARFFNSTTNFGAHLDSLADIVSFGVSPAIVMYIWSLREIPYRGIGWSIVLFYVTCAALRLARFNVQSIDKTVTTKITAYGYFTGVPITAAAAISLIPVMLTFQMTNEIFAPWFNGIYLSAIGMLMISRVPTFSLKNVNIKRENITVFLVLAGVIIAGVLLEPWILLPILGILYILLIPLSVLRYRQKIRDNVSD